jgi:hypothetical protein
MGAPVRANRPESQDLPPPAEYAIAAPVAAIKMIIRINDFKRVGFMVDSFRLSDGFLNRGPGPCLTITILARSSQNSIQRNVKKAGQYFT